MNEQITKVMFDPYVNDTFEIRFDDGMVVELKLVESVDKSIDDQEVFWFIFEGPPDKPLPQRIYTLSHPKMGTAALFLVPVAGKNKNALHYQAIFNRLKE
jgi:hypothetical protein